MKTSSKNVFLGVLSYGFAVLACMYVGSFIVSAIGFVVYYGVLLGASLVAVRYAQKKYLKG